MDKHKDQNEPLIPESESILKRIETVPRMSDPQRIPRKGSDQRRMNYVEFSAGSVSIHLLLFDCN